MRNASSVIWCNRDGADKELILLAVSIEEPGYQVRVAAGNCPVRCKVEGYGVWKSHEHACPSRELV